MIKPCTWIRALVIGSLCFLSAGIYLGCSKKEANSSSKSKQIEEIPFETSMGKDSGEYAMLFSNPSDVDRFVKLKALYEKNLPSKITAQDEVKIPKIVHWIWLGPKLPPQYFSTFKRTWEAVHPGWEFRMWTDADINDLNLELKDLIDRSPNYAEKSDILRSELLDRFGGVYLDVDMECHHALDELHQKYDFYAGIEYPHKIATTNNRLWLGISIMASKPGHPVIKRWKQLIRERWNTVDATYTSSVEKVINHTYFPFTVAFFEKYQEGNLVNMTFPATYFYPLSASNAAKRRSTYRSFREKIYDVMETWGLKKPRSFSRSNPETLAVHYWGNTWIATTGEQVKDLQQQVDFLRQEIFKLHQKLQKIEGGVLSENKQAPAEQPPSHSEYAVYPKAA